MRQAIVGCVTAVAFATLSVSGAFAGVELRGAKGGVLVNKGAGYQQTRGSASLVPGDRVMVSANSQATLVYGDGCKVPVNPGSVVTIGEKSPCELEGSVRRTRWGRTSYHRWGWPWICGLHRDQRDTGYQERLCQPLIAAGLLPFHKQ